MLTLLAFLGGALACLLFAADLQPALSVSAIGILVVFVAAEIWLFGRRLAALSRFMLLLYFMPFTALVVMALLEQFEWWDTPAALSLIAQDQLMRDMALMGLVGLFGLVAGLGISTHRRTANAAQALSPPVASRRQPLQLTWFFVLLAGALFLSAVSAADKTILEASYESDALEAATKGDSLSGAYVLSYILLSLLYIDIQRETASNNRRTKLISLLSVVGFIVVFLQVLRGDRECSGLLVALSGLYLTTPTNRSPVEQTQSEMRRLRKLAIPTLAVVLVFLAVGQIRYSATDSARARAGFFNSIANELASGATWTAVLLGNLGLVAEYRGSDMEYLGGETYVDYALALPPRVIGEPLGLQRNLSNESGPGLWYYPLQAGGVHPVVVPFKNFGIVGVFVVLGIFGVLIGAADRCASSGTIRGRLVYATFFTGSFQWFWYGDMPFIRTLMAGFLAYVVYGVLSPPRRVESLASESQPEPVG